MKPNSDKTVNLYRPGVLAVWLVLLAACSGEDGPVPCGGRSSSAVTFTDSRVETRAYSENTAARVRQNGFGVACVTDRGVVAFNERAVWNPGASTYSTVTRPYYFPSSGTLSFYAVYPSSQPVTLSSGRASLHYPQDSSADLLAAGRTGVSDDGSPVLLEFGHILSLVHFKAEGLDGGAVYRVRSISVDVPASGVFDYESCSWTPSSERTAESCFAGDALLSGVTEIPSAVSLVPCAPVINVEWGTYDTDGATLIAEYSVSRVLDEPLAAGEECTITLKLPNRDALGVLLDVEVKPWTATDTNIVFD